MKTGNLLATALVGALAFVSGSNARAQSEESELPPAPGEFEAAPLPPPEQPFLVPDMAHSVVEKTQLKERWITLKLGVVALVDYTAFSQDANRLSQVGRQKDQWEARAARLMIRGTLGMEYKIGYLVAAEYKGFESEPEDLWSLTDFAFTFPISGPATKLTLGKTKETFAYEMDGKPIRPDALQPGALAEAGSRKANTASSAESNGVRAGLAGLYPNWRLRRVGSSACANTAPNSSTALFWVGNRPAPGLGSHDIGRRTTARADHSFLRP